MSRCVLKRAVAGDRAPQLPLSQVNEDQRRRELLAVLITASDLAAGLGLVLTWDVRADVGGPGIAGRET